MCCVQGCTSFGNFRKGVLPATQLLHSLHMPANPRHAAILIYHMMAGQALCGTLHSQACAKKHMNISMAHWPHLCSYAWRCAAEAKTSSPAEAQSESNSYTAAQFDDGGELASIWDYDPPVDLAGSGAWNVLRELATTLSRYGVSLTYNPLQAHIHMCVWQHAARGHTLGR